MRELGLFKGKYVKRSYVKRISEYSFNHRGIRDILYIHLTPCLVFFDRSNVSVPTHIRTNNNSVNEWQTQREKRQNKQREMGIGRIGGRKGRTGEKTKEVYPRRSLPQQQGLFVRRCVTSRLGDAGAEQWDDRWRGTSWCSTQALLRVVCLSKLERHTTKRG